MMMRHLCCIIDRCECDALLDVEVVDGGVPQSRIEGVEITLETGARVVQHQGRDRNNNHATKSGNQ